MKRFQQQISAPSCNRDGNSYDGFNLIYGSCRELHYFTNRGGSSGPVQPGIHALSNHLLDSPWPKVTAARERLADNPAK